MQRSSARPHGSYEGTGNRPAVPIDRPVAADQRGSLQVADQSVVLNQHLLSPFPIDSRTRTQTWPTPPSNLQDHNAE